MTPVSSAVGMGKLSSRIRDLFFLFPQAVRAALVVKHTANVFRVEVVSEVEMKNNFGRLKKIHFGRSTFNGVFAVTFSKSVLLRISVNTNTGL